MKTAFILSVTTLTLALSTLCLAETVTIPAGTRVFGELDQEVSSDIKEFDVGDVVSGRAWRSIVVDGQTVVSAGSPMVLQVSEIQKRRVFGRAGSVELRAMSVTAVDGSEIFLDGGYDKQGERRIVLSSTLAALVVWPALFIKGKEAVLEPGLVFDASVPADTNIAVEGGRPQTIRIGQLSDLTLEVLYDQIEEDDRDLPIRATLCDQEWAEPVEVTAVNEGGIDPIEVELTALVAEGPCQVAEGLVDLKDLSEHFSRGITGFQLL